MRLAALVESPDHVCCRYRLRAFEPLLQARGHEITHLPDPGTLSGRVAVTRQLSAYDAVILQRRLPPWWERRLLRKRCRRLIFDLDDAVWSRDSFARGGFHSRKRSGRFRSLMPMTDQVVAGNQYLADACRHAGARRLAVIPTCVDVEHYPVAGHAGANGSLVWIGSSSTLNGIEAMRPLWERLGREIPNLELRVICDRFPRFDHLQVVEIPWRESTERQELAASGIGISWIPDDPWSRGKCGLKVLQSMAAGLPVVANPVGVHPEMITPGVNGFLAGTPDEWAAAIRTLSSDRDLRKQMGENARQTVRERYSVEAGAAAWMNVLEGLA